MKAIISAGGKFHAFDLARELDERGYLERLITSYPKFETSGYGIPRGKVVSIIGKEILQRTWGMLPSAIRKKWNPQLFIHNYFDIRASRNLSPADIFVGWSAFSLLSMREAKKMGMVTLLDHGSSHIVHQRNILEEERTLCGELSNFPQQGIVDREVREFAEADYIVLPSLYAKKTFIEQGIRPEKILQVPYGANLSLFRPLPKYDNVFRVVYVGGMTLQKGVHYLLQAFSELRLPNSELLLVGGASDEIRPFFKKYEGSFSWVGAVPHRRLNRLYSQGSVFVLNSIDDGFGMVIMQAMACGLPVIATTNTGGPDIIQDGKEGYIIPIRNTEVLKERLVKLYEDKKLRDEMSFAALARVKEGFGWADYGVKIVAAYTKALEEKHAH